MTAIIIISAVVFVILLVVFLLASFIRVELEYDNEPFVKVKYLCFSRIIMPETKKSIRRKKRKEKKEKKKQEKLLKKREKQRKKRLRGQHLNKSSAVKKASSGRTGSQPSPKTDSAQKSQQVATGTGSKNADSESSSDKREKMKFPDKANTKKSDEEKDEKPKPDLSMIISCIRAAKPYVRRFFRKIRIYDAFAEIVVGGGDAAKAAISYGIHCAAVNGFVAFLKNTVNLKIKKIDIKADFDLEKTDYYVYCKIKLRLSTFLRCIIWGYFAVQKAMNGDTAKGSTEKVKKTAKKAA